MAHNDNREAVHAHRARHRDVWGVDPPIAVPGRIPTAADVYGPTVVDKPAQPAPVEHDPTCPADPARVEATRWSTGQTATRCVDCSAIVVVPESPQVPGDRSRP